jgi:hypothetical protein
MRQLRSVFRSKLLSPILLTALLPLSFRSAEGGIHFVFLGKSEGIALALWSASAVLVAVAIVRGRKAALAASSG